MTEHSTAPGTEEELTPGSEARQTRVRAKQACTPCKKRKKRCNGQFPCTACIRYEYDCQYEEPLRKRRKKDNHEEEHGRVKDIHTSLPDNTEVPQRGYNGANAGSAFAKLLGSKLDSEREETNQLLAWNVGMGEEVTSTHIAITKMISLHLMQSLAKIYFETVHVAYGFVNRNAFEKKVVDRWSHGDTADSHDHIFCGVAALGSLFSGVDRGSLENALVDCAKTTLESVDVISVPTWEKLAGLLLRTTYLRSTARPNAAWIASCTVMHMAEAILIREEEGQELNYTSSNKDILVRDRVFWVGRLFNTWISHEYGRSRVEIRGTFPAKPPPAAGDKTTILCQLLDISETLMPTDVHAAAAFQRGIAEVSSLKVDVDGVLLSKANLSFSFYRRLQLVSPLVPQATIDQILAIGSAGLGAAGRLASKRQPWWHVANIPFQFICILLVMDTKESLAQIARAVTTLQQIAESFSTKSITKAVDAAQKLIQLSQKHKLDELVLLNQGLECTNVSPAQAPPLSTSVAQQSMQIPSQLSTLSNWQPSPGMDIMDFTAMDWDTFLGIDIPIYDGFTAPISSGPPLYMPAI